MKKLVAIMLVVLVAKAAVAQTEDTSEKVQTQGGSTLTVVNKPEVGMSTWITIYNGIGRISDTACVRPGETKYFGGYLPPLSYEVRAEVTPNLDCSGAKVADLNLVLSPGETAYLQKNQRGEIALENFDRPLPIRVIQPNAIDTLTLYNQVGNSAWVTIYNNLGRISDVGCVQAGDNKTWNRYYPPFSYKVRTEIMSNADCTGNKLGDTSMSVTPGSGAALKQSSSGGYYLDDAP